MSFPSATQPLAVPQVQQDQNQVLAMKALGNFGQDVNASEMRVRQVTDETFRQLAVLDTKRSQLINDVTTRGLDICPCNETNRVEMENDFIRNIVRRFPPHPDFELSIMSLGSGGLLQDVILLKKMVELGYRKFFVHFIDPRTTQEKVEAFKQLLKNPSFLSAQISIDHSQCLFEEVGECRKFHCIHAMDFEKLKYPGDANLGWKVLVDAAKCLEPKGILFCSAFHKRYLFDAASSEWEIPMPWEFADVKYQSGADVTLGCTNLARFWQTTFFQVAALAKMQARNIHVELIKPDEESWVFEYIPRIQQLCQQILSPKNHTHIDFAVHTTSQKDRYNILALGDQFIDQKVLEAHLTMVKPGGLLILMPEDCWKRIDPFREVNYGKAFQLKKDLERRVCESLKTITDQANALVAKRSVNLWIS